jgi:pyruvate formate lyase activating enzyme
LNRHHETGFAAGESGRLHSIETFGTLDGPGIRVVLFFQGCPLRCVYCHNRDTWDSRGGRIWQVEPLKDFVLRYKPYMEKTGGGVTATGGEPLLQHKFITRLFEALKKEGVHTALDTSGYGDVDKLQPLFRVTDLVLLDIKAVDPLLHKKLTGRDNAPILAFAQALSQQDIPVWIRHVLVPGLTDAKEDLLALRRLVESLGNVERVELLPYHTMGAYKWNQMGCDYPLQGVPEPTAEQMARAYEILGTSPPSNQ